MVVNGQYNVTWLIHFRHKKKKQSILLLSLSYWPTTLLIYYITYIRLLRYGQDISLELFTIDIIKTSSNLRAPIKTVFWVGVDEFYPSRPPVTFKDRVFQLRGYYSIPELSKGKKQVRKWYNRGMNTIFMCDTVEDLCGGEETSLFTDVVEECRWYLTLSCSKNRLSRTVLVL